MIDFLLEEKTKLESELVNQDLDLEEVERKVEEYRASLIKELETNRDAKVNLINVKIAHIDELIAKCEVKDEALVDLDSEIEAVEEKPFQETESEY